MAELMVTLSALGACYYTKMLQEGKSGLFTINTSSTPPTDHADSPAHRQSEWSLNSLQITNQSIQWHPILWLPTVSDFAGWIWPDTIHVVAKASTPAEHTKQICFRSCQSLPKFLRRLTFRPMCSCLYTLVQTPLPMQDIWHVWLGQVSLAGKPHLRPFLFSSLHNCLCSVIGLLLVWCLCKIKNELLGPEQVDLRGPCCFSKDY